MHCGDTALLSQHIRSLTLSVLPCADVAYAACSTLPFCKAHTSACSQTAPNCLACMDGYYSDMTKCQGGQVGRPLLMEAGAVACVWWGPSACISRCLKLAQVSNLSDSWWLAASNSGCMWNAIIGNECWSQQCSISALAVV